eukprot:UN19642
MVWLILIDLNLSGLTVERKIPEIYPPKLQVLNLSNIGHPDCDYPSKPPVNTRAFHFSTFSNHRHNKFWDSGVKLSGPIPKHLPNSLTILVLNNNGLVGVIPELPKTLIGVGLSGNQLTALPKVLPPNLQTFKVRDNLLEDPIPNLPTSLIHLDLSKNIFQCKIPKLPINVTDLILSDNKFYRYR